MKLFIFIFILCLSVSIKAKADTVDNYQIYLKKVLMRNDSGFPKTKKNKSYISLNKSVCNEYLELHFHHCTGYEGKRKVIIVDKNSAVIREFDFRTTEYDAEMNIPISVLCESQLIKSNATYSLIYFDNDVKEGRYLTDFRIFK